MRTDHYTYRVTWSADIPGVIFAKAARAAIASEGFVLAIAKHRFPERETDPPLV